MSTPAPKHIAIIMDGNGRWAKKRLLPRKMGHRAGVKAVHDIVQLCAKRGVAVLTLFAFSSENWQRPIDEVETLMNLFLENLQKELPTLKKNNIRLSVIGDRKQFSQDLQTRIADTEKETVTNNGLQLILALSYGGQWDICQAAQQLAEQVAAGALNPKDISPAMLNQHLSTAGLPDPDLLIRTSGEQRISNFLLWQLAYSELYFTDVLWPDFDEAQFNKALEAYAQRVRRFGLTGDHDVI